MLTSILQASAATLQQQLSVGEVTSVRLVQEFLDQIERHNSNGMRLNAVISVLDRNLALETANRLDKERKHGKIRSSLHGIPIIIKDCIVTGLELGMPTTIGSHCFARMRAKGNAQLANQLIDGGMIILGKGNLTEFCGLKSKDTPIGWSAYMGQTLSAHRLPNVADEKQPTCGGSTSGPAVSIAAGFCPLAIGTETSGSTVYPASCCGLYGMKLAPNSVSTRGVFRLSESFDGVGVLARTPIDIALLAEIIMKKEVLSEMAPYGLTSRRVCSWAELCVGVVPNDWGVAHALEKWRREEVKRAYENIPLVLKSKGAKVKYPLGNLADGSSLSVGADNLGTVAYHEFPGKLKEFLANFEHNPGVESIADVIKWNEEHSIISLPDPYNTQTELIKSRDNDMTEDRHRELCDMLRRTALEKGVGKAMQDNGLDIILAPSDSTLVSYAAWARWPIGTVPLGRLDGVGQPFGLFALAREGREDTLLQFMFLFEETFPSPPGPTFPFE
ncbi:amidase signature enzyme [Daldinia eschscholtzii]|nr:amidase signature enzyme [Daldinia eschscholtzii]